MESNAAIRYDDFVRLCNVDDPRDFAGFQVRPHGLYVNLPPDNAVLLAGERAVLSWHPTGRYDEPALPLPCTFNEMQTFIAEAGLLGAIDEFELEAQTQAPTQTATTAPMANANDAPALSTTAPAWSLITSLTRTPGYRWPLYQFLKNAHAAGQPCPTAQDVLDAWKLKPLPGMSVIRVGRYEKLEYQLEHGGKKNADLKAVQAAIKGLIVRIGAE